MKLTVKAKKGNREYIIGSIELEKTPWVATKNGFANKEAVSIAVKVDGSFTKTILTTPGGFCRIQEDRFPVLARKGDTICFAAGDLTIDL